MIKAIIRSPIRALIGVGFTDGSSVLSGLTLLDRTGDAIQDRSGLFIQTRV